MSGSVSYTHLDVYKRQLLDGLKSAGIIEDDSFNHIELVLRCGLDKADPHVEIEVTPC